MAKAWKEKCQSERSVYDEESEKENEAERRRAEEKRRKRKMEGTKKEYEISGIRY